MTAVEWYIKKIKEARQMCDDVSMEMDIWHTLDVLIEKGEQAKEMEEMKIIEAKIELIKSIGNQGKNASLYGILKTTLIELQQQHNEIIARCLN